jgi:hypothetical protein
MPLHHRHPAATFCTSLALLAATAAQAATPTAGTCQARSGANAPVVVELYTSEGCSSCPPADRWLSTLKGQPEVLALAFHVNYWDRLGWPDRFASAEATARQHELAQRAGSNNVYTPQVIANGRDWRIWPKLPAAGATPPVAINLSRDGDRVSAQVTATPGAPAQLAGYWAVLEDQHESRVRAGENAGETLRHDHVVRLYKPVAAWQASTGGSAQLTVSRGVAEHPRRVVFVVTDAATLKPLQALALAC